MILILFLLALTDEIKWIFSQVTTIFHRSKSGIWGWRTDKTEAVNGFEAKVHIIYKAQISGDQGISFLCVHGLTCSQVFTVNNVNVVIRTRTEHLTDEEKARIKSKRFFLSICRIACLMFLHFTLFILKKRWKKCSGIIVGNCGATHQCTGGKNMESAFILNPLFLVFSYPVAHFKWLFF